MSPQEPLWGVSRQKWPASPRPFRIPSSLSSNSQRKGRSSSSRCRSSVQKSRSVQQRQPSTSTSREGGSEESEEASRDGEDDEENLRVRNN